MYFMGDKVYLWEGSRCSTPGVPLYGDVDK